MIYYCNFFQKENGDRAFKVKFDSGFKEITLSARAVNGLIKFNEEYRNAAKMDKMFLKALFIGLYTLKRIREVTEISSIDQGVVQLAKGLYQ